MITMREYWAERVREQLLGMCKTGDLPAVVHNNTIDFCKSIDMALRMVDYPTTDEERDYNKQSVIHGQALIRALEALYGVALRGDSEEAEMKHLLWPGDTRRRIESIRKELRRCMCCFVSHNWWPAAATIRYSDPTQNHAEVVGCAPYFREEVYYEGIEYDANRNPVEPVPEWQILVSLCGYLDHPADGVADLIITNVVGFSSTKTGDCMAQESIVRSEPVSGMTPDAAWQREVQRAKGRSKSIHQQLVEKARDELMLPESGSVH